MMMMMMMHLVILRKVKDAHGGRQSPHPVRFPSHHFPPPLPLFGPSLPFEIGAFYFSLEVWGTL